MQYGAPAGSARTVQPLRTWSTSAPRSTWRQVSAWRSSVARSRWARTGPSGSSSRWSRICRGWPSGRISRRNSACSAETPQLPAGHRLPEGALLVVRRRRDVEADLVDDGVEAAGAVARPGRGRRGRRVGVGHEAEREAARRGHHHVARLRADGDAGTAGLGVGDRGPDVVDVEVEVDPRAAALEPLHPQVVVARRRHQRGELAVLPAPGRAAVAGDALPVGDGGLEVVGRDVQERRDPEHARSP